MLSSMFNLPQHGRFFLRERAKVNELGDAHEDPPGFGTWPTYAAIRLGHTEFIEMLLEEKTCSGTGVPDHGITLWWPWPCACSSYIHNPNGRSLLRYASDLEHVRLCASCEPRRDSYKSIAAQLARALRLSERVPTT